MPASDDQDGGICNQLARGASASTLLQQRRGVREIRECSFIAYATGTARHEHASHTHRAAREGYTKRVRSGRAERARHDKERATAVDADSKCPVTTCAADSHPHFTSGRFPNRKRPFQRHMCGAVQTRLFMHVRLSALINMHGSALASPLAPAHASAPPVGAPTHQQCCLCVLGL